MKKNNVRRFATLLALVIFAVLSIGGDGCFDWSTPNSGSATPACCPEGWQYYGCSAQVQLTTAKIGMSIGATSTRCYAPDPQCASSLAEAQSAFAKEVQAYYFRPGQTIAAVQSLQCAPHGNCQSGGAIKTQDYPGTCNEIVEVDAGVICFAGTDACTSCLNDCCAEYAACVAAGVQADCDAMVNYWQGTGPAASTGAQQVQDLDICFQSLGCGSVSVCTQYLPLHDGGLGFGGGYP